jgi:hypothetical protein
MSAHDDRLWRERVALRYLDALDAGDIDAAGELWEQAAEDPELEALLRQLDEGLEVEEDDRTSFGADASRVLELVRVHMPGSLPSDEPALPPTAADVARRLEAEPEFRRLEPGDRVAHAHLLAQAAVIPDALGQLQIDHWLKGLGVDAGPSYRRAFRKVAVLLEMARCQQEGRLAAARRATPPPGEKGGPS